MQNVTYTTVHSRRQVQSDLKAGTTEVSVGAASISKGAIEIL